MTAMKIDRLILGDFQSNSYVVRADESATQCLIVDTGLEADELVVFLAEHALTPVAVVLTHGHIDHIAGLAAVREAFGQVKVYIHRLDAEMLTNPAVNLSMLAGTAFQTAPADVLLDDGDIVTEAGVTLQVLHTPGHTAGGICLYAEPDGVVFVGDTLFADSIGRSDFPGGDGNVLIESIRTKLLTLPPETTVCPGHGMRTSIGREKRSNPFLT